VSLDANQLASNMTQLLERVCYEKRPCKFCGRLLYFVLLSPKGPQTGTGLLAKKVAYSEYGVDHFKECSRMRAGKQRALLDTLPDALEPKR
jgi:hypothetical protein